jgi:hypothetical protein
MKLLSFPSSRCKPKAIPFSPGGCLAFFLSCFLAGCGVGQLQTARPTPPGKADVTLGGGFIYNENVSARGLPAVSNFPFTINTRWGVDDRVDIGARLFLMAGGAVDIKVNLMRPTHPLAVSLSGGLGAAYDIGYGPVVSIPVTAHLSYDFACGVTPYVAAGYRAFWILLPKEREDDVLPQGESYADREGYGSGLVSVNGGLAVEISPMTALLFDYSYLHQVVNDPGDSFTFIDNHLFLVGVRIRFPL